MNPYPSIDGRDKKGRLFRIFVASDRLCAAYLTGYDDLSLVAKWKIILDIGMGLYSRDRPSEIRREQRARRYGEMDPTSQDFLLEDGRNFHIGREQVQQLKVEVGHDLSGRQHVSGVTIELHGGNAHYFLHSGDQDAHALAGLLRRLHPQTQVIGNPVKPGPPRWLWILSAVLAAVCLGATILCVLWFQQIRNVGLLVMAVIFGWAACCCLRRVRKYRGFPVAGDITSSKSLRQ